MTPPASASGAGGSTSQQRHHGFVWMMPSTVPIAPSPGMAGPDIEAAGAAANMLAWEELACHVPDRRRKGHEVTLLQGVCGVARSGQLTAIIGPSGSGKSTCLDMLAQRKTVGRLEGRIAYNGALLTRCGELQKRSAYVVQEDSFHPTITVMEAVLFHAQMRLCMDVPLAAKLERAREVIALAGLQGKEDAKVGGRLPGGIMVRGLSGGEKRRLSLCCGIVEAPEVLFCDEPTSGLDSLAALKIVQVLHGFATGSNMAVLCTIHQPRQSIWECFSKLLVLAAGRQLFFGSPAGARFWFTKGLGLTLPADVSLADFIIDTANVDFDKSCLYGDGEEVKMGGKSLDSVEDLEQAAAAFRAQHPALFLPLSLSLLEQASVAAAAPGPKKPTAAPRWTDGLRLWTFHFHLLFQRNLRIYTRNPGNVLARFLVYTLDAVATGVLIWGVGGGQGPRAVADVMGALFFNLLAAALFPYASISLFLYDRQFYQGENASGLYPCSCYFLANCLLEAALNTVNAVSYAIITYPMIGYAGFVQPLHPGRALAGYLGILVAMNQVSNAQVLCFSLLSPNLEIAFISACAYTTLAVLLSGSVLSFPAINTSVAWLQYLSSIKYGFQALNLHFFSGNTRATTGMGTTVEEVVHVLQLNTPETVWANVLALLAAYTVFMVGAFVCLKYLYKEKR